MAVEQKFGQGGWWAKHEPLAHLHAMGFSRADMPYAAGNSHTMTEESEQWAGFRNHVEIWSEASTLLRDLILFVRASPPVASRERRSPRGGILITALMLD
jgi:hypothetical protein